MSGSSGKHCSTVNTLICQQSFTPGAPGSPATYGVPLYLLSVATFCQFLPEAPHCLLLTKTQDSASLMLPELDV